MCRYRRVTVKWPDGREGVVLLREDPEKPRRCDPCGLSEAAFRTRDMVPHDTLEHLELYHGAKVTRGRRLSEAQAEKALGVTPGYLAREEFKAYAMPGVLVDPGKDS
ncbi:hypothetical protein LCGC14_2192020 [marine sediment metagenome]|uniref:Uncharacterized protein n=1 Tax=marine sediment metagenome TaxID=412755 RepID=A0A0F9E6E2_9ZZZZ